MIVDTAGRLHTQTNLMDELAKVRRVIAGRLDGAPHEVLLVVDATTGQNGLQQARLFNEAVGVTGVALTKLDGSAKGGIAVAIAYELGLPVKLVGVGEGARRPPAVRRARLRPRARRRMTLAPASDFDLRRRSRPSSPRATRATSCRCMSTRRRCGSWSTRGTSTSIVASSRSTTVSRSVLRSSPCAATSAWIGGVGVALASRGRGIGRRADGGGARRGAADGDPRGDRAERDRQAALRQPRLRGRRACSRSGR